METYVNDKGEEVIIQTMDNYRLIHAIAKYARKAGVAEAMAEETVEADEVVKALKAEALKRLAV